MAEPYGTLTVVCGPMYAGKTTEMLKRVLWVRNGMGRSVMVFKPSFDNRYSTTEIVSHDGLRSGAESVIELPSLKRFEPLRNCLFVLDEVQFFTEPHVRGDVVEWTRQLLSRGHDVVVGGLDMDYEGKPFPVTASLAAMADEVIKATANCTVCGRPAAKTWRNLVDRTASLSEEPKVELGATDKYEARCNNHWP